MATVDVLSTSQGRSTAGASLAVTYKTIWVGTEYVRTFFGNLFRTFSEHNFPELVNRSSLKWRAWIKLFVFAILIIVCYLKYIKYLRIFTLNTAH